MTYLDTCISHFFTHHQDFGYTLGVAYMGVTCRTSLTQIGEDSVMPEGTDRVLQVGVLCVCAVTTLWL